MPLEISPDCSVLADPARRGWDRILDSLEHDPLGRLVEAGPGQVRLDVWAWSERFRIRFPATPEAVVPSCAELASRLREARSRGLREHLDVAEAVLRRRRLRSPGMVAQESQHFIHALPRAEAVARAVVTGRRGGVFFDPDVRDFCVLAGLGQSPARYAVALESDLHTDDFDRRDELSFPFVVVDEGGEVVGREEATLPVLTAAHRQEQPLETLLASSNPLVVGRDPATRLPFLFHRTGDGEGELYDYLNDSAQVDLQRMVDFPPAEILGTSPRPWRQALRCPRCGADLPWDDRELGCSACSARFPVRDGVPHFVETELPDGHEPDWLPSAVPKVLFQFLCKYPHGLVLDCGSGRGTLRAPNLINLEIFPFANTTVVADGQRLPFRDGTVDAILSEAVLEHVPDPFAYCDELRRVLRPGGELRIDSAFLQAFHGCPGHYFNTTAMGLQSLLRGFRTEGIGHGEHQGPFVALQSILGRYARSLAGDAGRDAFLGSTVGELLSLPPGRPPRALRLRADETVNLASGVYVHAVKEEDGGRA